MLKLNEAQPVSLPTYTLIEELQKSSLLDTCRNHQVIKEYLPDKENLSEITRDYLLMVSCYLYIIYS